MASPTITQTPCVQHRWSREHRALRIGSYEISFHGPDQFAAVRITYMGERPEVVWETGIFRRLIGYRIADWFRDHWYKERAWINFG